MTPETIFCQKIIFPDEKWKTGCIFLYRMHPGLPENGENPMSDVYSERLFSRETRVSAWFASSNAVA
ncbi:MAG TPA: hypothetical protein DDZ11_12150, partial [Lentisphaeria bacterium]|nr:hypothetical protein [Lentisphaeria bacterium]